MQFDNKQVRYSVALLGLSFVYAIVPGLAPPAVFFRTFGAFPRTPIIIDDTLYHVIPRLLEREPMLRGA